MIIIDIEMLNHIMFELLFGFSTIRTGSNFYIDSDMGVHYFSVYMRIRPKSPSE